MKNIKLILLVKIMLFGTLAFAKNEINCSVKPVKVSITTTLQDKNITVDLPIDHLAGFKSGKLKGCDAIIKKGKITQQVLSAKVIKDFKAGYVFSVSLPKDENGMDYDLVYDVLVFEKADNQLLAGPVILAGGLENSIENQVVSAAEKQITVKQLSAGEGESSEETIVFKYSNNKWNSKP